jgi:hypothetical protein
VACDHKKTPGSRGGANKEVVLGIVEREGELRAAHVPDGDSGTLQKAIRANVAKIARLMIDEDRAFLGLERNYPIKGGSIGLNSFRGASKSLSERRINEVEQAPPA